MRAKKLKKIINKARNKSKTMLTYRRVKKLQLK